jgi:hypothetical protein
LDFLTKAYGVFNVNPIGTEYDAFKRKEVAIEVPPESQNHGRIGQP